MDATVICTEIWTAFRTQAVDSGAQAVDSGTEGVDSGTQGVDSPLAWAAAAGVFRKILKAEARAQSWKRAVPLFCLVLRKIIEHKIRLN
jgi:hypothetical protein